MRFRKFIDLRFFPIFVVFVGSIGYVIHRLTGLDLLASMAVATVGILIAGWAGAFIDED